MTVRKQPTSFRELRLTLSMIKRSKVNIVSIGVVIFFYAMATTPGLFVPRDPYALNMERILELPTAEFPLGTDELGRDVLSRVVWGSRFSMFIGFVAVALQIAMGVPIGAISGYAGGRTDNLMMRITDTFLAFPSIVLAMLLAYAMGRGMMSVFFALGIVGWTYTARLVRGVVMAEKEKEYVIAAKAMGKSSFSILFGEILPNAIHPVIVTATLSLGTSIVAAAGLSFIGVGIQPPDPDWGILISSASKHFLDRPLIPLVPGIFMMVVVLAINILGDALRDAFDPRLRREIT